MKKSIFALLLPGMLFLNSGVALSEVNVQTDNLKVRVGQKQGVTIERRDLRNEDYSTEYRDPWGWFPLRNYWPFDQWIPQPRQQSMRCQTSHQETSTNNGDSVSYSSTSTEVCN